MFCNNCFWANRFYFICKKNDKYGISNKNGDFTIPIKYTFINKLKKYIFIAEGGEYIPEYRMMPEDWYVPIDGNGNCGLLNNKLELVMPIKFIEIKQYNKEDEIEMKVDKKTILLDKNLKCINNCVLLKTIIDSNNK